MSRSFGAVPDGPLHEGLGPPQKPLSVGEAFSTGIEATVDDMHSYLHSGAM